MDNKTTLLSNITNALATPDQVKRSHMTGLSPSSVSVLHFTGASLIQVAGAILKLPNHVLTTACVLFHRFHLKVGFFDHSIQDSAAACLFVASKVGEAVQSPGQVLAGIMTAVQDPLAIANRKIVSHDVGHASTQQLYDSELQVLTSLAFDTHVVSPHALCLQYIDAIKIDARNEQDVTQRAWNYLNDALRTRIYILHQPHAVAITAIWLAARELNVELLDGQKWWEAFDVDTEDMGHILLLLREERDIGESERRRATNGRLPPLTVDDVVARVRQDIPTHVA
ncbi:cyclin-like protein [Lipomyces japonicus]|uniref:cyclin-like protein n=1 Tax=Lipomyces japonicus TaxID=56871 RepID=UPI0034CE1575